MGRGGRLSLLLLLLFTGACRSVPLAEHSRAGLTPSNKNNSAVDAGAAASTAAALEAASGESTKSDEPSKDDEGAASPSSDGAPGTQSGENATAALESPPVEPGDLQFPINLAAALQLSDARPLIVAAAQATAWQAEAQFQKARVLWLPDFYSGFDYTRHDGYGPDTRRGSDVSQGVNAQGQPDPGSFGTPLNQNVNYLYAGGAFYSMRYVTDAVFEPLRARQHLDAKRWDIQMAKNDALLLTAQAYFNVHKFRGQYAGALDVVKRGRQLVDIVQALSKDLVPAVEVDRARNLLADMEQQAATARQYWRRSSIDLTQVLRLDPRVIVEPLEADHLQITLIEPSRPLTELMPIGLTYRPELASYQAQIQEQLVSVRREQMRAFLPAVVLTGFQTPYEMFEFGALGIGQGSKMNNWFPRVDFAPQLLWQADSLGFGNMAMVKRQRSQASQSIVDLYRRRIPWLPT